MGQGEGESLTKDYTQARDNYRRVVDPVRQDHDGMVRIDLLPANDGKSEP